MSRQGTDGYLVMGGAFPQVLRRVGRAYLDGYLTEAVGREAATLFDSYEQARNVVRRTERFREGEGLEWVRYSIVRLSRDGVLRA